MLRSDAEDDAETEKGKQPEKPDLEALHQAEMAEVFNECDEEFHEVMDQINSRLCIVHENLEDDGKSKKGKKKSKQARKPHDLATIKESVEESAEKQIDE